jgi:hypothetical protein
MAPPSPTLSQRGIINAVVKESIGSILFGKPATNNINTSLPPPENSSSKSVANTTHVNLLQQPSETFDSQDEYEEGDEDVELNGGEVDAIPTIPDAIEKEGHLHYMNQRNVGYSYQEDDDDDLYEDNM